MDRRRLIAALVEKTGLKLDEDDPAFLLVELNLLLLDERTKEAARELDGAAEKLGAVTTRSVDDFVSVANEALSKFIQRTKELMAAIDAASAVAKASLAAPRPALVPAPSPPASPAAPSSAAWPAGALWWLLPSTFGAGALVGAAAIVLLK